MLLSDFFEDVYRPLKLRSRSPNTLRLYRRSLALFSQFLERPAKLSDLTDEDVGRHLAWLVSRRLSPYTVNKERSQLLAVWNYAARKQYVGTFPDVDPEPEPECCPTAWSTTELAQLMLACRNQTGWVGGVPAADWWVGLHLVLWDTGERIGAVLATEWNHLRDNWLVVPAHLRKGRRRGMTYRLHPSTAAHMESMRLPLRELLFPWPHAQNYIYHKYSRILKQAGLPCDSHSKFHRMRRSVATHLEIHGGDATLQLGHCDRRTTEKSYLDPRMRPTQHPADLLPRIA